MADIATIIARERTPSCIITVVIASTFTFTFANHSGGGAVDIRVVEPRQPSIETRRGQRARSGVLHLGVTDTYPVTFHVPGAKKHAKVKLDAMSRSL